MRIAVLLACLAAVVGVWIYFVYADRQIDAPYSLIEDGLYMGGHLKKPPRRVRAVLNLCEIDDPYRCDVHLWEPIPDAEPAPDIDWLRRMVEFVDAQRRAGLAVYVHCLAGVSRSGMVVVAYLMFKNRWTRDDALAYVRTKREIVRPNRAFMERLLEWERVVAEMPKGD